MSFLETYVFSPLASLLSSSSRGSLLSTDFWSETVLIVLLLDVVGRRFIICFLISANSSLVLLPFLGSTLDSTDSRWLVDASCGEVLISAAASFRFKNA